MPGASFASRRAQAPAATRSETANVRQVVKDGLGIREFLTASPLCTLIRERAGVVLIATTPAMRTVGARRMKVSA
jgi:hypothetical protein